MPNRIEFHSGNSYSVAIVQVKTGYSSPVGFTEWTELAYFKHALNKYEVLCGPMGAKISYTQAKNLISLCSSGQSVFSAIL